MLKKDIRCNEITQDIYYGIESYNKIADKIPRLQERSPEEDFFEKRKEDSLMFYEFYKLNKAEIDIIDLSLSHSNYDLLLDSVQACFLINLNFKLLSIINNIKNRLPNLRNGYPAIEDEFSLYEAKKGNKELVNLGGKLQSYFVDIRYMAVYWKQLLDYLGYDTIFVKMFIEIYNSKYDIGEDIRQPLNERYRRIKEINKLVKKAMRKYQIKHFWD